MKIAMLGAAAGMAVLIAGGAQATHHHAVSRHHTASKHHATSAHHAAAKHGRTSAKHDAASRHAAAPAAPLGATAVPAGGTKLYCPARKSPLLVRKTTQGNGTTVTVICR